MRKKKRRKTPPVLKNDHLFIKILLIVVVAPIILTVIGINYYQKRQEENSRLIDEYPAKIETMLEEKYEKEFIVESCYKTTYDNGSFIPGRQYHHGPYRYQVYAKEYPDYLFQACVYPKSEKDKTISKIRDSYCWQFLREQIKQYVSEKATDVLPEEYKLVVDTHEETDFGDNVFPGCPTRYYFSSPFDKPRITISVILPPDDNGYEEQSLKEGIYPILEEFYNENGGNMYLNVAYCHPATYEEYTAFDIKKRESETFIIDFIFKSSRIEENPISLEEIFSFTIGND